MLIPGRRVTGAAARHSEMVAKWTIGTSEPVLAGGKYITHDTWYDADGKPFQPQAHY